MARPTQTLQSRLESIVAAYADRADTGDVRFALASPSREWQWEWAAEGAVKQYFIASSTKLYVTALIMQLRAEGSVDLDAPAAAYLDSDVMTGILPVHS